MSTSPRMIVVAFKLPAIALLLVYSCVPISLIAAEPSRRSAAYETPERAFLAYQAAVEKKDLKTGYEALTKECQDTLLFDAWADQLTGKTWPEELNKFIEDAIRREHTHKAVPSNRRELAPLLADSLRDRHAAFAILRNSLDSLRSNSISNLRVARVKIEGNRATAKLLFKPRLGQALHDHEDNEGSSPGPDLMHFFKDDQGWLVDLRPDNDFVASPKIGNVNVTTPNAERTKYSTPHAAFDAFQQAQRQCDAGLAWDAMTSRFRNDLLFNGRRQLLDQYGDNIMLHWYGDQNKFAIGDVTNPLPTQQEERAAAFGATRYDLVAYLTAIFKRQRQIDELHGRELSNELRAVTITDNRALGKSITYFRALNTNEESTRKFAYQLPCYFRWESDGWQIDLPTTAELQRTREEQQHAREQAKKGEGKREKTFADPAAVLMAYNQAIATCDVPLLIDCLIPENCDEHIFYTWADQFHFQTDPPSLDKFIDEERRRQLTREHPPILSEELMPLLMESITDRSGALAASFHRVIRLAGELRDLEITGDEAKGKLVEEPKPAISDDLEDDQQTQYVGFVKDAQGWRLDLSARFVNPEDEERERQREEDREVKQIRVIKPRNPKPWTNKPVRQYKIPEEVHQAQRDACVENDPEAIWHCMTDKQRNGFIRRNSLMLVESGGGDLMLAWYFDMFKFNDQRVHDRAYLAAAEKLPPVDEQDEVQTSHAYEQRERLQYDHERILDRLNVEALYDPRAYFSAIIKRIDLSNRQRAVRNPKQAFTALDRVVTKGDRAFSVQTERLVAQARQFNDDEDPKTVWRSEDKFEVKNYFARVNGSWLLDVPSQDEHIAEWREEREDSHRSRQEAERERRKGERDAN